MATSNTTESITNRGGLLPVLRTGNFEGQGYAGRLGAETLIEDPSINKGQSILTSTLTQTPQGLAQFMQLARTLLNLCNAINTLSDGALDSAMNQAFGATASSTRCASKRRQTYKQLAKPTETKNVSFLLSLHPALPVANEDYMRIYA